MISTTSLRTSIIATDYDGAVYTAGQPIYSTTTVGNKTTVAVLVDPGRVVFYNPATQLSTGTAATKSTVPLLKIGVAIDSDGDGTSDYIRWFNDGFTGCGLRDHSGKAAACGLPHIVDAHFGCIECNQTYTISVTVYDPITEAFGHPGLGYKYQFTYFYPCGDCSTGDCVETTPSADEVMCGLYNKIKGINNDPNWDITYNNLPMPVDHEYRFDVSMLYDGDATDFSDDTTFEYCLTAAADDCEGACNEFTPAIGGYNIGDGDEVFSPGTFVAGETPYSTKGQIISAVAQLNAALAGNGSAVFLPAVGNCCSTNKIEVNTCLHGEFVLNNSAGEDIEPCATSNPFSAVTVYSQCQDCDSENTARTFLNGLRFFSKPIEGECDCIPGNHSLVEYFSEISVAFREGWKSDGVRTLVRQQGTLPKNQGFQIQADEIRHFEDGFTRPFVTDLRVGKYGLPAPNDLLNQISVDCKDSYCSLEGTYQAKTRHDVTGETSFVPQTVKLLIPSSHTTAQTSVLLAWNNYFAGGDCGLATITCAAWT